MKKSKNIVLIVTPVLSAALFNACGGTSQPYPLVNTTTTTPNPAPPVTAQTTQTRDVYNSLDDCVKDWLDKELCEQMSEEEDSDYKKKYKAGGKNRYFYGPGYFSNNRIITYKGKTITPTGKAATKLPTFVGSVPASKTTTGTTTSTTKSSTLPSSSTTGKSTTSTTSPSSSTSSTSSTSTYNPYSSSSTTRSGFGSTSSSYSSSTSSRSSSSSSSSGS